MCVIILHLVLVVVLISCVCGWLRISCVIVRSCVVGVCCGVGGCVFIYLDVCFRHRCPYQYKSVCIETEYNNVVS